MNWVKILYSSEKNKTNHYLITLMNNIHPTSIIDEGAELGNHLSIGPYCRVGAEVKLGDGCHLKSHVVLDGPSTIGSENIFFPFSLIGGEPQDLKFNQEKTQLIVGSKNTFR